MALTVDTDLSPTGGQRRRLPSEISANPFQGSLLSYAADGFVHELAAGEPFAGICAVPIATRDAATADGSRYIEAIAGEFVVAVTLSVTQADVNARRRVFASDDGTLSITVAAGNTPIGHVIGVDGSKAIVLCQTAEVANSAMAPNGLVALADAAATLTTAQLDKVLYMTPTAGRTLTLPPAAGCIGRSYTITTLAGFAITLDGDAAETVNGAATFASGATAGSVVRVVSNGSAWVSC